MVVAAFTFQICAYCNSKFVRKYYVDCIFFIFSGCFIFLNIGYFFLFLNFTINRPTFYSLFHFVSNNPVHFDSYNTDCNTRGVK